MNEQVPRVLLVEDTRTQALMIRGMLETGSFACEVVHVPTLGEALEVMSGPGAAVTLLDLTLPDASGLAGVVAIRNAAPDLPIVVVTADDDEARAVKAVQLGAQDYLTKGRIDPGQLSRAVRYAIERKRSELELARQALHDPLTGLPNRTLFLDRLLTALAQASRRKSSLAVLFLDLDGFKQVNDRLGHRAGDGVLRAVASRLVTATSPGDTVARFGGDEFTILGTELDRPGDAEGIARRLTDALAEPFAVEAESVTLGASIGIALAPGLEDRPEEVIARADGAMYRAKQAGRAWELDGADAAS